MHANAPQLHPGAAPSPVHGHRARSRPAVARPEIGPRSPAGPGVPAMASPSPPHSDDAAVCCMCGDHGLPRELFRCRSCRVRLQHSYCSDLYPRATAYRRCNWCLRDRKPAQAGVGAAAYGDNKPAAESKRKASNEEEQRHQRRHEGCSSSSRRPPAELGYPVKRKRKADDERAPPDAGVKGTCSNAGENKEVMRAGKARVKVQRYKLLAEVISC